MPREGKIPIVEIYRGVGLHDSQTPERLIVVRSEIDQVINLHDLRELVAWAEFDGHSPESRLLAGAKAETILAEFGGARQKRPRGITPEFVAALTAGLESQGWRSPSHYGTLVDNGAVERETPLDEER
jgi:hypothetical protein